MFISYMTISLLLLIIPQSFATTEWFGDLRAQLNPPRSPPFYDVTYDDTGKKGYLIKNFKFFISQIVHKAYKVMLSQIMCILVQ
jgi:hypothetical protein